MSLAARAERRAGDLPPLGVVWLHSVPVAGLEDHSEEHLYAPLFFTQIDYHSVISQTFPDTVWVQVQDKEGQET